jgi:zinc/manganese transport system permease protein
MNTLFQDNWFLWPLLALMAGLTALAPLGVQVLRRGVVFIDLAVAQAAAASVLWLDALVLHEDHGLGQLMATAGALLSAALVAWLARRWPRQREALIGLLYIAGATLAMLGARLDAHGRDRMLELLAADVLWAQPHQVLTLAVCALMVGWLGREAASRWSRDTLFFACFAIVASLAVPALGLFVVFACLIAPALWVERGVSMAWALAGGMACSLLGLVLSWQADWPSGACVALMLSLYGASSVSRRSSAAPNT